jgi:hypothetical protein
MTFATMARIGALVTAKLGGPLLCAAALGLTACSGADEDLVGITQQPDEAMNGLAMNGLAMNGLAMNGLVTNGLTANGLMMTGDIAAILDADPLARMFMRYVVSCALPAAESIVFPGLAGQDDLVFTGGLGVAPEWGTDGSACDTACQEWVSSCVIARVNALGQHVPLSIRGDNPGLALAPREAAGYPRREATYFGNVFASPQELYACRAAGDDQALIGRACGDGADVSRCGIDVLGDCHVVCADLDPATGAFGSCTTPANGTFGPASTVYRMNPPAAPTPVVHPGSTGSPGLTGGQSAS